MSLVSSVRVSLHTGLLVIRTEINAGQVSFSPASVRERFPNPFFPKTGHSCGVSSGSHGGFALTFAAHKSRF